jgi:hypothetical protein
VLAITEVKPGQGRRPLPGGLRLYGIQGFEGYRVPVALFQAGQGHEVLFLVLGVALGHLGQFVVDGRQGLARVGAEEQVVNRPFQVQVA